MAFDDLVQQIYNSDDYNLEKEEVSYADRSYLNKLFTQKLVETNEEEIQVLQNQEGSPLFSVKKFQELPLSKELLDGVIAMGFRKPSRIQEVVLPLVLSDRKPNIVAQSQSGTGKSAAFLIAMLAQLDISKNACQAICLAPTRELASQTYGVALKLAKYIQGMELGLAVPESYLKHQNGIVSNHMVVGTPGKILHYFKSETIRFDPNEIKVFVFDEADIMCLMDDFIDISSEIMSYLPESVQTLLFSATFEDEIDQSMSNILKNPIYIRVKKTELSLKTISQYYIPVYNQEEKYKWLVDIYMTYTVGQAIIFCATRHMAAMLTERMIGDGHHVGLLTGALTITEREEVIEGFRKASERVLISTNLCSRGLDIPQVNLVINWDMPRDSKFQPDCETYLHRIGRSGRFGKKGLAINFVTDRDREVLETIEENFGIKIEQLTKEQLEEL